MDLNYYIKNIYMKEKYLTYRRFNSLDEVEDIIDILKQNAILFRIEDNSQVTPSIIMGESSEANIRLKLQQSDFEKADKVINLYFEKSIGDIESDYYLLSFNDDELIDVINKKDEWSHYDYNVAKIELKKRGIEINEKLENAIRKNRLKELTQEEKGSTIWMIVGYISAFLGGILGIAIGLSMWRSKRTLPTGARVSIFNKETRINGIYITVLGIIMFIMSLILWVLRRS